MRKTLTALVALSLAAPLAACDVDQTEEGDMPDVEVEGGEMPEYDVETGDVEIEQDTVTVPEVEVEPPAEGGGQ